jgi:hypothetical protein
MAEFVFRSGELLARTMNRRKFLGNMAIAVFGTVAASAARFTLFPDRASAATCQYTSSECDCSPPGGLFCTSLNNSYCYESACSGGCTYNYTYYPTACWCTQECCYGHSTAYRQCCDCWCNGRQCGCQQIIYTCVTAPEVGDVARRIAVEAGTGSRVAFPLPSPDRPICC